MLRRLGTGPRGSRRTRPGPGLALVLAASAVAYLGAPAEAGASVRGKQGIEIEGAQDRRGFFVGTGIGFGGTFFYYDDFVPATRVDLVLGGGVGLSGVPKRGIESMESERGITVGLGGKVDFGYEFFLNATAAMGVVLTYDARFVPGSRFPRQTALVGARFSWY